MSDLTSLMNLSPEVGAYFTGQNQAQNNIKDILSNQTLKQQMELAAEKARQEAELHPLTVQNKKLTNEGIEAENPGRRARSLQDQLKAKMAGETYASDRDTHLAENEGKIGKAKEEARDRATKFLTEAGALMESTPATLRGSAFRAMVEQSGMKANHPDIQMMLEMSVKDPQGFPGVLSKFADRLGNQRMIMNPAARASRENNSANIASSERIHNADRASREKIADQASRDRLAKINKTKDGVEGILAAVKKGLPYDKAAVALRTQAVFAETPEEKAIAEKADALAKEFAQEYLKKNPLLNNPKAQLDSEKGLINPPPTETGIGGKAKPTQGKTSSGASFTIEKTD